MRAQCALCNIAGAVLICAGIRRAEARGSLPPLHRRPGMHSSTASCPPWERACTSCSLRFHLTSSLSASPPLPPAALIPQAPLGSPEAFIVPPPSWSLAFSPTSWPLSRRVVRCVVSLFCWSVGGNSDLWGNALQALATPRKTAAIELDGGTLSSSVPASFGYRSASIVAARSDAPQTPSRLHKTFSQMLRLPRSPLSTRTDTIDFPSQAVPATPTSSPATSHAKARQSEAALHRPHAQRDSEYEVKADTRFKELAHMIASLEHYPPSPRQAVSPAQPSPNPARSPALSDTRRKLLKPRRSMPLLSALHSSPAPRLSVAAPMSPTLDSLPRRHPQRSSTPDPFISPPKQPISEAHAYVLRKREYTSSRKPEKEEARVSYRLRPRISYPMLISAPKVALDCQSRHASVEWDPATEGGGLVSAWWAGSASRRRSFSLSDGEEDDCTIRAATPLIGNEVEALNDYEADDRDHQMIFQNGPCESEVAREDDSCDEESEHDASFALAADDSFSQLIYAFPSPAASPAGSPSTILHFPHAPSLLDTVSTPDLCDSASSASSSGSSSSLSTPVGTPVLDSMSHMQSVEFTPIFSALSVDSLVSFDDDTRKRHAVYSALLQDSLGGRATQSEDAAGSSRRGPEQTASSSPQRRGTRRGFMRDRAMSIISSISTATYSQTQDRGRELIDLETEIECRAPFYLEDDALFWPQVLTS